MPIPKSPTGEMPFLDHLEELRWRIIYSLGALVIGISIGFLVTFKLDLIGVLQRPVLPYLRGQTLVFTHPGDTFSAILQMSFVVGIIVALPVIGWFSQASVFSRIAAQTDDAFEHAQIDDSKAASQRLILVGAPDPPTAIYPPKRSRRVEQERASRCLQFALALDFRLPAGRAAIGVATPEASGSWAALAALHTGPSEEVHSRTLSFARELAAMGSRRGRRWPDRLTAPDPARAVEEALSKAQLSTAGQP